MMINLSNTLKKKNNKKGFTLIELIVVIAILAILAAIAIPRFGGLREDSQDKANRATAASVLNAAELYFTTEGKLVPAGTGTDKTLIGGLIENNLLRAGNYTGFTLALKDPTAVSGDSDYGLYTVEYDKDTTGAPGGVDFTIGN
ncbi:prepilin-type N-terminal cleavage/methylation domain-containing protein [Proteiniclasticum sp.]|uniref:prepilin-type N-terminal cleavage/methylation domain-containing protein n=1 Tax=Proteiniclasticum sp. TaxID=2053595 RepID=UPI00289B462E|nr:prepilin-type N-terminal cleavage/methylation domain-containing protein [Proteiniclasticum sp.]